MRENRRRIQDTNGTPKRNVYFPGSVEREGMTQTSLEEDLLGRAHARLEVEHLDVLPALLEEGDKEVDGKSGVALNIFLGHVNVSDGGVEAQNLLHLELDGAADLSDLVREGVSLTDEERELTGTGKTRTQQTGDLLDEGVGREEGVVLAGELLHELLVLVELLEVIDRHGVKADLLGLSAVSLVAENAETKTRLGRDRELEGAVETLVLGRIVVLEANLKLDGLLELALLAGEGRGLTLLGDFDIFAGTVGKDLVQRGGHDFKVKLGHLSR
mmetsp:Transcript_23961/g.27998  ORF Transcript_23961/g.27998 Transcript_23961/m.27998 type:complete len:272 (-) Transcript_23961:24-839(-)